MPGKQELTLEFISLQNFVNFLKRFITIDSHALLEFRTDDSLMIKSYTPSRSAIKVCKIPLEDIFDYDVNNGIKENIKMGIYNLEKVIKRLDFYKGAEHDFTFTLTYQKDNDGDVLGVNYVIKSHSANVEVKSKCANKTLFKYMPDDLAKSVFNTDDTFFTFDLEKEILNEVKVLGATEVANEITFKPYATDKDDEDTHTVSSYANDFNKTINTNVEINDFDETLRIYKDHLKFLDIENYKVYAVENGLIFISDESDIQVMIARVTENDGFDETDDEI